MTVAGTGEPAPIEPADILAKVDLVSPDEVWRPSQPGPPIRDAGVTIGTPMLYPLSSGDLPERIRQRSSAGQHRYFGMLVAFDLEPLPADHAYADVRFTVKLSGDYIIAVDLADDAVPPAGDLTWSGQSRARWLDRLLRPGTAQVTAFGRQSSRFGWLYAGIRSNALARHNYAMNAVLEAPCQVAEVNGTLNVRAGITRTMLGYSHRHVAGLSKAEPFTELLAPRGEQPRPASTRLCLAVDVERYTRHANEAAKRTQRRLVHVLECALSHAKVERSEVEVQEQGDGMLVVLPPVDESRVIPGLADGLRRALQDVNTDLGQSARIRLRSALDRGLVERAEAGYVGTAVTYIHRVLEAKPTRDALAEHPRSDFVFAVSDHLYQDVVSHGYHDLDPEMFWKVTAELPHKNFSQPAWLYVPRR